MTEGGGKEPSLDNCAIISSQKKKKNCAIIAPYGPCSFQSDREKSSMRPRLVHHENQKVFKIFRHIESYDTCMKH